VLAVLLVPTALGRVLRSASLRFLGRISYPLFFVHTAVLIFGAELIRAIRPEALAGWSAESIALLTPLLAAAIAVAALAHAVIERPALRWKARATGGAMPEPSRLRRAGLAALSADAAPGQRRSLARSASSDRSPFSSVMCA
jgi:peptidoglycan/LPS O-acetylase OafA/YrhL